jgi:glyoxylase-like metal-dependent hydrolase (beta-lactamase superfamily II)
MKNRIIIITLFIMSTIYVQAQKNENIFSIKQGASKLVLLSEGQRNGSADILIKAAPEITAKYAPDKSFPMATNAFLWQVGRKNILFDTGYGKSLFDNLQSIGVKPEDIDVIFITHMHGDHIGGLIHNGQVAFPKAELYLSQAEYNYWTSEDEMHKVPENAKAGFLLAQKAIAAYKGRLHLFEPNAINPPYNKTLYPGVKAIAAYGHTPGHTVYLIESGKDQLLVWGDLAHAMAVQMPHPEIAVSYDSNPEEAIQSRAIILRYVSEHAIPIAGMHIPYPSIGIVKKSGTGYMFIPEK